MNATMSNFLTYALLFGYFAIVIAIGVRAAYKETSEGFLISDRDRGGFWLGVSLASGWFGGDILTFYSGMTYSYGWAPLFWTQVAFGVGLFLLAFCVPQIKDLADRFKMYMQPDYFHYKYSRRCGAALLVCNFTLFFAWLMLQFVVGGKLIAGFTGFPYYLAVVAMATLTLPYLVLGGYKAVISTDILQFLFLAILCLFLLGKAFTQNVSEMPLLSTVGSMGGDKTFSLVILSSLWTFVAGDIWQHIYAARSAKAAKSSFFWAFIFSGVLILMMTLIFMLALPIAKAQGVSEDNFLIFALQNTFSATFMPFVILLLCIAIISSLDTAAFGASLTLTNNLASKFGLISPEFLPLATRITLCLLMVFSTISALFATDVIYIIYGIMRLSSVAAPVLIASCLPRWNFSERAIFWGLIAGMCCYVIYLIQGWSGAWLDLLPMTVTTVGLLVVNFIDRSKNTRNKVS